MAVNKVGLIGNSRIADPMRHFTRNGALVKLIAPFFLQLPKIVWAISAGALVITQMWPLK